MLMPPVKIIRGTKDILPKEVYYWQILEEQIKQVLELANYNEIRTPIFENEDLFLKSIGENTDIVNKEMYTFKDQGKRKITLRPEGTTGMIRSYIENKLYLENFPQRLWYYGPMFRYERPQSGRQRQFHQLGIECIGSEDTRSDAEVIDLACKILSALKIKNFKLCINSVGDFQDRENYKKALIRYLEPQKHLLDRDSQMRLDNNPLRILDSKDTTTQELLDKAPNILDFLSEESQKKFKHLCKYLDTLEIEYSIDPKLVRGLDYYTHTAFEIKMNSLDSQSTICGGGRYDLLIEQMGGPKTPAIGCALGLERVLDEIQLNRVNQQIDFYIATQGELAKSKSLVVTKLLRENGFYVNLGLKETSFGKQLKQANKLRAKACIFIGQEEFNSNNITIRWLNIFVQEKVADKELLKYLQNLKNRDNS
nr:histidine--tRNA ligase [Cavernulicola chilensis]